MKVYYFNDESVPVTIQTISIPELNSNNPYPLPDVKYEVLNPAQGKVFEFEAPDGTIPFIKRWNRHNMVLISYILAETISLLEESV